MFLFLSSFIVKLPKTPCFLLLRLRLEGGYCHGGEDISRDLIFLKKFFFLFFHWWIITENKTIKKEHNKMKKLWRKNHPRPCPAKAALLRANTKNLIEIQELGEKVWVCVLPNLVVHLLCNYLDFGTRWWRRHADSGWLISFRENSEGGLPVLARDIWSHRPEPAEANNHL